MSEEHNADEMEETGRTPSVNRRRFVKSLGIAGGAAAIGIPNTVAAENYSSSHSEYNSQEEIEEVIREYGSDVLALLAQEDIINEPSIAEFNTEPASFGKVVSGKMGAGVATPSDGVKATVILANKKTSSEIVTIGVKPKKKRGFAYQQLNHGNEIRFYNPEIKRPMAIEDSSELSKSDTQSTVQVSSMGKSDASTQGIFKNCRCTNNKCDFAKAVQDCDLCAFGHCTPYYRCACGL